MRKKHAMRWRKFALRRGAEIITEGLVFSKQELRENNLKKKDNAYQVKVRYKHNVYNVADDDMLKTYKLLCWCMDVADEEEEDNVYTIGGIWISETGRADWIKE